MSDILKGLVKGLSGFLPQDDPNIKVFNTQNALKDISAREEAVYARLGRIVYETQGAEYPDIAAELERLKAEKKVEEEKLRLAQEEKAAQERAAEGIHCPNCGSSNPEGTNFCQDCGMKLASAVAEGKRFCSSCGAEIAAGNQFCTSCGTKIV